MRRRSRPENRAVRLAKSRCARLLRAPKRSMDVAELRPSQCFQALVEQPVSMRAFSREPFRDVEKRPVDTVAQFGPEFAVSTRTAVFTEQKPIRKAYETSGALSGSMG